MIRLRFLNHRGEMLSPLIHSQIVTGFATTPDYLIVNCKRSISTGKKETDNVWAVTPLIKNVLNWDEVMEFLTNNQYEHVVLDKNMKPINELKPEKPKKSKKKDSPENPTLNFDA